MCVNGHTSVCEGAVVDVAAWLSDVRAGREVDVPCGTCTACCSSAQFVHVEPDDAEALAHIPRALLFPAPGGSGFVLGYDERGRCPMLGDAGCTIYEHRPMACRTYDCRVFPAAGVEPDKPLIAAAAAGWSLPASPLLDEVRARADRLRDGAPSATALAVRSVRGD